MPIMLSCKLLVFIVPAAVGRDCFACSVRFIRVQDRIEPRRLVNIYIYR